MRHRIRLRAWRGDDIRTVVWDDEAGTVDGDHDLLPNLREHLAAPVYVLGFPWGGMEIRGHRHDPADFLALLQQYFPVSDDVVEMPASLADVVPTHLPRPDPRPGVVQ